MSEVNTSIAAQIRLVRKAQRLTQEVLAERAGISPVSLSRIETGEYNPSVETLQSLSNALQISPSVFFTEPVSKIAPTSADDLRLRLYQALASADDDLLLRLYLVLTDE